MKVDGHSTHHPQLGLATVCARELVQICTVYINHNDESEVSVSNPSECFSLECNMSSTWVEDRYMPAACSITSKDITIATSFSELCLYS